MKEHIYVVEDDQNIQEILKISLESNSYVVSVFDNAIDAISSMKNDNPDLAIFDLMLPQLDGISAIKEIRKFNQQIPILILSAKDSELDKIKGLDSGADDYLTKPFGVLELCARVRTLLRRTKVQPQTLDTKSVHIDKSTHQVTFNGQVIDFTYIEYQILVYLIENRQRVVERNELLNHVWGYDFAGESRTLDVHIRSLRKKLNDDGDTYIKTIRSVGYRFIESD